MTRWSVVFYETAAGSRPVQQYLDSVPGDDAARIAYDLQLLEEFGLGLGAPHVRSIGGKLWELRTRGRLQHRILYAAVTGHRFVLLHAFSKKTPRTPTSEIRAAEARLADYRERYG